MTWHGDKIAELRSWGYSVRWFRRSIFVNAFGDVDARACAADMDDDWDPVEGARFHRTGLSFAKCRACREIVMGYVPVPSSVPDAYKWSGKDLEIVEVVDTSDLSAEKMVEYSRFADAWVGDTLCGVVSLTIITRRRSGLVESVTYTHGPLSGIWIASLVSGDVTMREDLLLRGRLVDGCSPVPDFFEVLQ